MIKIIKQIGEGSESRVFLAQQKGEYVVVKEYKSGLIKEARREYLLLKSIEQPGVVKALAFDNSEKPRLIMEYIEGVSLTEKSPEKCDDFILRLSEIIFNIHNRGIVVNDLKPDNIMIKDGVPYLIDFSFATINGFNDGKFRGTPIYAAPEKFKFNSNTYAADLFSLGLIYGWLLNKTLPGKDRSTNDYIEIITDSQQWKAIVSGYENELIKKMLSYSPEKRGTILDVIKTLNPKWKGQLTDLKNIIFDSQLKLADSLLNEEKIIINEDDEPERIKQICRIKYESMDKQLIVLEEKKYRIEGDEYLKYNGIENISKLQGKIEKEDRSKFMIIIDKNQRRSRLFSRLESIKNIKKIIINNDINPAEINLTELKRIAKPFGISISTLKNISNNSPAIIRKLISSEGQLKNDKLLSLISKYPVGLSIKLIEKCFENWGEAIATLLKNGVVELKHGRLYPKFNTKKEIEIELIEKIYKFSIEEMDFQTALYSAKMLDKTDEIPNFLYNHITSMIKKEQFISALDFLEFVKDDLNIDKLPMILTKRKAFLLRKIGDFSASIEIYSDILNQLNGLDRAVVLSDRAVVSSELGDLETALNDLKEASVIFSKHDEGKKYIRTMNNIGFTYYQMDDLSKAGRIFRDVLKYAENNNLENWKIISLLNLADVSLQQGQWSKAEHFASQVAKSAEEQSKYAYKLQAKMLSAMALAARGESQDYGKIIREILEDSHVKENQQLAVAALEGSLALYVFSGQTSLKLRQDINLLYQQVKDLDYAEVDDAAFWLAVLERNFIKANEIANNSNDNLVYKAVIANDQQGLKTIMQDLMIRDRIYQQVLLASHLITYFDEDSDIYPTLIENFKLAAGNPIILQNAQHVEGSIELVWEIIDSIIHSGDYNEVLEQTLMSLLKVGKMERAIYFKEDKGDMSVQLAFGKEGPLKSDDISVSKTVLLDTASKDTLSFYQNLQEEMAGDMNSSIIGLGLRSAVCFPLKINGQFRGVFYSDTGDAKGFNAGERVYLEVISNQSKIQLEKLELMLRVAESKDFVSSKESFHGIIGRSKPMLEIYENIKIVAKHNINVLITGETGTGKELVARAIHSEYNSEKPFIAINCSAIPEQLLESELFGYKKGAFTGAEKDKIGLFEAARDGVLFLDEIGEMPLSLQPKVLRVLQERKITPLGSIESREVNMRIIAATNRDLEQLSKQGEFRQDLFYRLSVFKMKLPSLSERKDDIPALVYAFIEKYSKKFDKEIMGIDPKLLSKLQNRIWAGNVRELENYIEKSVVVNRSRILESIEMEEKSNIAGSFDEIPVSWKDFMRFKKDNIRKLEEEYLSKLLSLVNDNYSAAARLAKTNRIQLYRLKPNETK